MPITLGLNISSLKAQQQLSKSSDSLSKVFERLSSGQRINRASDDAAGLAIADSLNADARVYTQGIRNLNDGLSILNVADGALQELTNITFRLTELAEQAANGTLGKTQRASLDEEAQALSDEYFRIIKSTKFNGRQLFESDYGELRLQAGYGLDASIGDGLGGNIGDGTFESVGSYLVGDRPVSIVNADFNGDGNLDFVTANWSDATLAIFLGDGSGSFQAEDTLTTGGDPASVIADDFNQDGIIDLAVTNNSDTTVSIFLGNGDGSFTSGSILGVGAEPTDILSEDFNGDGISDLAIVDFSDENVTIALGNGEGSFTISSYSSVGAESSYFTTGDYNNDGFADLITANKGDGSFSFLFGKGDGTFETEIVIAASVANTGIVTGDFNNDGIDDFAATYSSSNEVGIFISNGDKTFTSPTTYSVGTNPEEIAAGDFDGDGNLDLAVAGASNSILLGDGYGNFTVSVGSVSGDSVAVGDYDNNGVVDLIFGASGTDTAHVLLANTTDGVAPLLEFSLTSIADAKQALSQFQQKLDQLSTQRGEIGAFQSRVQVADNVLGVTTENYKAAESRIRDADIAQESASLVRLQILQQAASSVLAQANIHPELTLLLLSS